MPAPAGAGAAATRPIPYGAWRGGQRLEALSSSLGEVGANQGPFRPGRNLGAEEDAGLPIGSGQVPPGATWRAGGLKSALTWDKSGRSEECPLRLAPPIYPDRAGTGRGKFRGRYRGDGRKMATSRFYRDKFRWPLQEDAAVLTMVPDRVRTGLPWAAEQRTGLPAAGRQECLCYFKERSFVVALLRMTILRRMVMR